ncbi:hypothetical protein J3Q64DRAFT_1839413 [Phycomyces blakesleeanus]|uniref:polynucleotide adenylyltransferase n=2 Tax=Phycomyces blakesleeanus TaxID=4837 RepID=A0A162TFS3_PHYB8|nr:hypothetical protein PHYBLDRAFT_150428 [Phycomyces blakesleeanus NRRL 1555(-)]OAD68242.1 hypothetical protein PHYBLDRAFT_150428 [Phycomyces blakesleeanus NRRL 1555(-)]|eukprot:XP_018286282.1 hypothetical protein PHYBLDRAFT_150428 [Phycomyces blakesleeanus NRRL 1555(-)]
MSTSPWANSEILGIKDKKERLSKEILAFTNYIAPTKREQKDREILIKTAKGAVESAYYRDTKFEPFGSYVTGLLLPGSDVDINVTTYQDSGDARRVLGRIRKELMRMSYDWNELLFIRSARIPVLTIDDKRLGTSLDLTVNNPCFSSDRTVKWLAELPELKPIFLTLKHAFSSSKLEYMRSFELMSSKNSGFASYTIICLIVAYIKTHKPENVKKSTPTYYSDLLIGFLHFYSTFDFKNMCLDMNEDGKIYPKSENYMPRLQNEEVIIVLDPDVENTNVARSSSRIRETIFSITEIYNTLLTRIDTASTDEPESILSSIIKVIPHNPRDPRPEGKKYEIKERTIKYVDHTEDDEDATDSYNDRKPWDRDYNRKRERETTPPSHSKYVSRSSKHDSSDNKKRKRSRSTESDIASSSKRAHKAD